jgi:hypothetical protein
MIPGKPHLLKGEISLGVLFGPTASSGTPSNTVKVGSVLIDRDSMLGVRDIAIQRQIIKLLLGLGEMK